MKFKKKKSFWKEFFNECTGVILVGAIMIYIALSAIIGNLILPYKEINPYIEDVSSKFSIFLIKTIIGAIWLFGIIFVLLIAFAIIGTIIIFKVVSLFMDMRVSISAESLGIDISEHGEGAYNQSEFKSSGRFISSNQTSLL